MKRLASFVPVGTALFALASLVSAAEKGPAERGRDMLFHQSYNPAAWSLKAYDNLWKQWGLSEKPVNYDQEVMKRYGLHAAPFDNKGRPMGLIEAQNLLGKGMVNNCLLCHAGTIAGQTLVGMGNSTLDLQSLFEDLTAGDGFKLNLPFRFSYARGSVDPVNSLVFLLEFRDHELELRTPAKLRYTPNVSSDPPAWWLLKRKKTRDWNGGIDARSARVDMVNLLTPLNSGSTIRKQEQAFADIAAFVHATESPKYPFAVNEKLAARGRELFNETCAKCHGTYGADANYPNKIVPLGVIGTDRTLVESLSTQLHDWLNRSWLARELDPEGKPMLFVDTKGYQAPPLDGVWATAPYLHNASVPTVYHLLNSQARPMIYTRSYETTGEAYDSVKLGWKITVLDRAPDSTVPLIERRKVYDATQPGLSNGGHTFGDEFQEDERMAVIEYLKTL